MLTPVDNWWRSERLRLPPLPLGLSLYDALEQPTLLPLEVRRRVAMSALRAGQIDGWQALGFTVYGIATVIDDDDQEQAFAA